MADTDDDVAAPDAATTTDPTPVSIPVLANDNDPENDPLQIVAIESPAHGTASLQPDQRITYTDAASFAVMDAERCRVAMSFDRDFRVAGFELWQ